MPDTERNARLAEWMGRKWVQDRGACKNRLVPPYFVVNFEYHGKNPEWPDAPYDGPAYDTPAAALELLGWLAEKGWSYITGWDQADGKQRFCRLWKHRDPPGPDGKRLNVITRHAATESKAIAEAAEAVLDLEEGE